MALLIRPLSSNELLSINSENRVTDSKDKVRGQVTQIFFLVVVYADVSQAQNKVKARLKAGFESK